MSRYKFKIPADMKKRIKWLGSLKFGKDYPSALLSSARRRRIFVWLLMHLFLRVEKSLGEDGGDDDESDAGADDGDADKPEDEVRCVIDLPQRKSNHFQ